MKMFKMIFSRMTVMAVVVLAELLILLGIFWWFGENAAWVEGILRVLSLIIVLLIVRNSRHLSSDMIWILIIVAFPVPGTAVYLLFGANLVTSRTYRQIRRATEEAKTYYHQDETVMEQLKEENSDLYGQFQYISGWAGFPVYWNTGYTYYPLGDLGFPVMLEEMRKAEKFIFLEYFIIEEGEMWNSMLAILQEKAKQGLDIRVMYDDFGSIATLSAHYSRRLEEAGIRCISFNRINPLINVIMNHRDHRKIMVIDGKTAFTGGINLADEYINRKQKYGHWKDNVVRVKGKAVWSFTVMFLTHWNALRPGDESFLPYRFSGEEGEQDGFLAPYGETPLDNEITAQNIYLGMINHARRYCYIFTPYLIIDTEMINTLILAAGRGVDVRIITPGIPDKKLIWKITRSYYKALIDGGVTVLEYTPGFVHSKVFVCDDELAAVGTINLDYRSLYLHFENGTLLGGSKEVLAVRHDFLSACEKSHVVTVEECRNGVLRELALCLARMLAPLL